MSYITKCPRCGERAFENLGAHSHCIECLYFEDRWESPLSEVVKAVGLEKELYKESCARDEKHSDDCNAEKAS